MPKQESRPVYPMQNLPDEAANKSSIQPLYTESQLKQFLTAISLCGKYSAMTIQSCPLRHILSSSVSKKVTLISFALSTAINHLM